ncbi:MAG: hypothetical protein AAB336_07705 [Acidobacteriota bacterium]
MFQEDRKTDEAIAKNFSSVVDSMADRRVLWRLFLIGILANSLIWMAVLLMPEMVYKGFNLISVVSDKLGKALLGIPLFFTAFTVYALFRFKFPDIEEQKLESEMMSTFVYQANSAKRFWIWISSITFGIINTALLVVADLYLQ